MGYIRQLSDDLIKQIAAGEVVERPASVVKELVENSIDAKSKRIEIEIERTGKLIQISDDGEGIHPDDIPLLFSRHATSKLKQINDLWDISTLGFRGEALASISSVSRITCASKHKNQETGFEIKVIDGKIDKKSSSISVGTVFEVNDLFYNIPAREKFLKSEQTEIGHIIDVVLNEALSYPHIAFKVTNNNNVILQSSGSNDCKQVIYELIGDDFKNNLIQVSAKGPFVELSGYISTLELYKSNRKNLFTYVNSRPIKCPILSKAILSAYEGLIPSGKYPVVVLNLKFQPGYVDVNVHPTKKEVRYQSSTEVYNLVLRTLQAAISDYYKAIYKEQSVYQIQDNRQEATESNLVTSGLQDFKTARHSQAAFDLYADNRQEENLKPEIQNPKLTQLFSASNLECNIVYSDSSISNMTKIGNKTIFEVGTIFDNDIQVVFKGEIFGDSNYQKEFFNQLANLSENIYKHYVQDKNMIQKQILHNDLEHDSKAGKQPRKKPSLALLEEVWNRDFWTCVYCGKQLIDPKVVSEAVKSASNAFVTYINKEGSKVTNHVVLEHVASYDHHLPVSKLPQFTLDKENLFACCINCNRKKSNSMELNSWIPNPVNSWKAPLEVAGLTFKDSKTFLIAV